MAAQALGVLATACLLTLAPARAGEDAPSSAPRAGVTERAEPRHVVLLVDRDPGAPEHVEEHSAARQSAMPMVHLGAIVHVHDVRHGPPRGIPSGGLRGVVTHFEHGRPPAPTWLLPWLRDAVSGGARLVVLENPGCLWLGSADEPGNTAFVEMMADAGVRFGPRAPVTTEVSARRAAPELLHEEYIPPRAPAHWDVRSVNPAHTVAIETWRDEAPDDVRQPVIVGAFGGVALHPWYALLGDNAQSRRWRVDAFAFFADALDMRGFAAPDPSVLNGRRVFFCHFDGDGFVNPVPYADSRTCGEVLAERVLDAFELPFTVSVVVGELTDDLDPAEPTDAMITAARLLARPNVEAASHGVLHPFYWHTPPRGFRDGNVPKALDAVADYEFSWRNEVVDSVRFIDERLLRDGKRCELMLWTGTALPDEETLRTVRELGLPNLNSGEFRWDAVYDSVGNVSALGRRVGAEVQVYAGGPNEIPFDGFFERAPGAFKHAAVTIERAGGERILKPANVYAHVYSVERIARLRALLGLIRKFGVEGENAPVFASVYARSVASALTTARVTRTDDGWELNDFGDCRTVRIDDETRVPDLAASPGVLGYRRRGRALYVHLADADATLTLAESPRAEPHVHTANHVLTGARRDADGVAFGSRSLAPRRIDLAGFRAGEPVAVRIDGAQEHHFADERGHLLISLPPGGPQQIEVRR